MPIIERVLAGTGYAHAVTVSGTLAFVSGQVAMDDDGNLVGDGDIAAQTRQSLRNLEKVLHELGAGWADVVKFTWFVTDVSNLPRLRDVRDEFLRPALGDKLNPASSLIQVAGLFRPGFLVEVEAVVALP